MIFPKEQEGQDMAIPPQMLKACPVMAADSSAASSIAIGTIS